MGRRLTPDRTLDAGEPKFPMDRLGNALARSVERALGSFTKAKLSLDYQRAGMARRADLDSLLDASSEPTVAMHSPLTGSVGGCVLLFGPEVVMRRIAGAIGCGNGNGNSNGGGNGGADGTGAATSTFPEGLDERSVSGLRECASVMGNAALNAMNPALGLSTIPSPPRMMCVTRGNIWHLVDESLWPDDKCLFSFALRLSAGEGADATMLVVVAVPSIDRMLESLSTFFRESDPAALPAMALLGPGEGVDRELEAGGVAPISASWEPVKAPAPSRAKPRVLVVDDSVYFRSKTVKWLRTNGIPDVVESPDGESAVRAYREKRPDLVLLDLVMDGKSGVEVLREIKSIDPGARVLVVSAVGQDHVMDECLKQGALGFLVKPVSGERLVAELRRTGTN